MAIELETDIEALEDKIEYLTEELRCSEHNLDQRMEENRENVLAIATDVIVLVNDLVATYLADFGHDPRYCVAHESCRVIRRLDENSLPSLVEAL